MTTRARKWNPKTNISNAGLLPSQSSRHEAVKSTDPWTSFLTDIPHKQPYRHIPSLKTSRETHQRPRHSIRSVATPEKPGSCLPVSDAARSWSAGRVRAGCERSILNFFPLKHFDFIPVEDIIFFPMITSNPIISACFTAAGKCCT